MAFALSGPPQTVFRKAAGSCEPRFIPDTAARAFRDWQGNIHLISSWQHNYAFVGRSFDSLKLNCSLLYAGDKLPDPSSFDDNAWLTSFYTGDGRSVFGLVHDEYHGTEHENRCASKVFKECWSNAITSTYSDDGGYQFHHVVPEQNLVAALPYRYGTVPMPAGYFAPSNIVEIGDYYYVMVWAEHRGAQRTGACLLRTKTLFAPSSWRAWSGTDFNVSMVDPYRTTSLVQGDHVCEPVGKNALLWNVSSLVRYVPGHEYVAVMQATTRYPPGAVAQDGVYYSVSPDLLRWSAPALLMAAPSRFQFQCDGPEPIMHPSLLDPESSDRNFSEIGHEPFLFYSLIHLNRCRLSLNVDMVKVQLTVR